MKRYIQRLGDGYRETVDELSSGDFSSLRDFRRELARLVAEYQLADAAGHYYASRRACANWCKA